MKYTTFFIWIILLSSSCSSLKLKKLELPQPVDTYEVPVSYQEKKTYQAFDVFADNEFDCARLNDFRGITDSSFVAVFTPENEPINESAYYGFRVYSVNEKRVQIDLTYPNHKHRYWPKLSYDCQTWTRIDSSQIEFLDSGRVARIYLDLTPRALYVCGQEIISSTDVMKWSKNLSLEHGLHFEVIGKSKEGRDIPFIDIYSGERKKKDAVVIISRQHPPETTGQIAMYAFVKEILADTRLSEDFIKNHRILIYPILNPDGVDNGNWRHNMGGIDLNRDWSYYRQPEIAAVTNHIVSTTKEYKNKVLIGLDFHSTQRDIYYTLTDNLQSSIYDFKDYWLEGIDCALDHYTPHDAPYDLNKPISKAWFYLQFNAEGITYEVGDETPHDFIRKKGKIAAQEMMKLLVIK